jgi:hypothetical protein
MHAPAELFDVKLSWVLIAFTSVQKKLSLDRVPPARHRHALQSVGAPLVALMHKFLRFPCFFCCTGPNGLFYVLSMAEDQNNMK